MKIVAIVLYCISTIPVCSQIEVVPNYDAKKYLGEYVIDHELTVDVRKNGNKFVFVALKRVDDSKAPIIAFTEDSPEINAKILNAASGVKVVLNEEKAQLIVFFLNNDSKPFFRSILEPFSIDSTRVP